MCMSRQAKHSDKSDKHGNFKAAKHANDALFVKAIWLDIDVGKKDAYPSLIDAIKAVLQFIQDANLPRPSAMVHSGGGLHVYWISERPLIPDEWRPYASGLKVLAQAHKLKCDLGVTGDIARVLRIPGTFNMKTGKRRPVRLLTLEQDYDFATALGHIAGSAPTINTFAPSTQWFEGTLPSSIPDIFKSQPLESLSDGLKSERQPYDLESAKDKCEFIRTALDTGGKNFENPLWNLTTLMAVFTENGHENAHRMASRHPDYGDGQKTEELWQRKVQEQKKLDLGPPRCQTIADEFPACANCKHFHDHAARGRTPLHLAHRPDAQVQPTNVVSCATALPADVVSFRDFTNKKPKPSLANAVIAIRALGIDARYDLFQHRIKVTYGGEAKTI